MSTRRRNAIRVWCHEGNHSYDWHAAGVLASCTHIQRLNVLGGNKPPNLSSLPAWDDVPNFYLAIPYQASLKSVALVHAAITVLRCLKDAVTQLLQTSQ